MKNKEIEKEIKRLNKLKEITTEGCWQNSQMKINLLIAEAQLKTALAKDDEFKFNIEKVLEKEEKHLDKLSLIFPMDKENVKICLNNLAVELLKKIKELKK